MKNQNLEVMKQIRYTFGIALVLAFAFLNLNYSQEEIEQEFSFEINRIHPPISKTKEDLAQANRLLDLNSKYKSSWIREYISIDISAIVQGEEKIVQGKNDFLNPEQKDILTQADVGTEIRVNVHYIPENNLKHNDPKELDFKVFIDPKNEAEYIGGQEALEKYLQEQAIKKIPEGIFENYDLAAVTFTIDEEGQVINPKLFWSSNDKKIDALLIETIQNMPCWKPAQYSNGTTVKQEFAFMVGNPKSCVRNMLNIDPEKFK